jgi:hypothetical protein
MDQEQQELFKNWSPPQVRGILELAVTSTADVAGVNCSRTVTSRRQFKMTMAPCPEVVAELMGVGMGSLVHINPVELSRRVENHTEGAAPAEESW